MMRKLLYSFLFFIFLHTAGFGQVLWNNNIDGNNPGNTSPYTTGQIVAPGITVSGISRSTLSGTSLVAANGNDRFNASGWSGTTGANNIVLNNYFEFTLTPSAGNSINFVTLVYSAQTGGSGSSVTNFAVRSSIDGYVANIATPGSSGGTISLSGTSYQGITSSITFRVYAWGGSGTRQYSINDFTFTGTVCFPTTTTPATICQGGSGTLTASSSGATTSNTFSGSWNGAADPTANMPAGGMVNSTTCSFDGTVSRNYNSVNFTVNTTGNYTFKMTDTNSYDGMAYIYTAGLTPGTCSAGWVVGSDDDGAAQTEPRLTTTLTAGVVYTLVSTTWSSTTGTYSGSYAWTVTPPAGGQVTLSPVLWYNSGGTLIGGGSPFNPVGVTGGLADTNTVGTTTFYASSGNASCTRTSATFTINGNNTPISQIGSTYSFCVDSNNTQTTANISAGQYALLNVIQGYTYTFQVGDIFSGNNEKINILNANTDADVSPAATNTGSAGATITNWVAPYSGQVKVVVSTGSCSNNGIAGTGGLTLSLNSVGNTLDDQTLAGTTDNTWRGHIYNWTSATTPPGGTSPTSVTTTTPFSGAEYVGYYNEPGESITQNFGGNDVCFPVLSGGAQRGSIRTEQFAVRYRMRSTKTGCYMVTVRGDDGVRLYVDGVRVVNQWQEQSATTYSNVFVNLTGSSVLVLDYYENGGSNVVEFSMTPFNASSNTITAPATTTVCSGTTPGLIDGSAYQYNGTTVNPTVRFQWESSSSATGPWSNVTTGTGMTSEDYTPAAITGNATQNITYYRRTVTSATSASCSYSSDPISITTNPAATLTRSGGTASQTVCSGSAITNIVYTFGGGATSASVTNLPAGLTSNISGNALTISGTPTAGGTYTVTTTGQASPCTATTANGTITINPAPTLVLTSGTASPTVCPGTAITNIVYTFGGGATGVNVTGLPAGLTSNVSGSTVTISGTPTAGGTYSVATTGQTTPCTAASLGGTVTINSVHTISAGANRTVCQNNAMSNITMTLGGGATGATITGLPAGVTYAVSGTTLTISGTPTVSGQFTYNVTTTGNSCTAATTSGTITVGVGNNTITYSNGTSGFICINAPEDNTNDTDFIAPTGTYFNTVSFASYGTANGSCPSFSINYTCHAPSSQSFVEGRLLGNSGTVKIRATNTNFLPDPCVNTYKYLRVIAYYSQAICSGTAPGEITGSDPSGAGGYSYQWQSSTSATGTFAPITGANAKNYTPGVLTQSMYYRRVVTSGTCTSTSPIILIKVNPRPTAVVSGTTAICNGGSTTVSVALTGTAPWSLSYSNGSATTNVTNITASPYTFNVNPTANTTYTVTALSDANCTAAAGDMTGSAVITVRPRPTATISGTTTTCYGVSTPVSVAFTGTGPWNIWYTYGGSSGTFSTSTNPYTVNVNPTSTTTYEITALSDANCTATVADISAGATITVRPQFTAGAIQSTGQTICYGQNPSQIGGTTAASGGDGTITYRWQSSTDAAFTSPTTISSDTQNYTPAPGLTVSTWYRRQAKDGTCNAFTSSTNVWAVTVRPQFTAGAIQTTGQTICLGQNPSQIGSDTAASGGNGTITYKWQAGGVDIAGSNSATYTPPAGLATTTTYTRFANDGACNTSPTLSTGSWTVTVRSIATTPTVGTKTDVTCLSQGTVALSGLPSGSWQINQSGTATASIPGSGTTTTITGLAQGTYYFTVQTATTCASAQTGAVSIGDQSSTTWTSTGWSNGLPSSSKSVIIASTVGNPFAADMEACRLTISIPNATGDPVVTVPEGITLTITNEVSSNGKLVFESGASLVQTTNAVNTGEIVYKRKISVRRYDLTYWSMPVTRTGFSMHEFSPGTLGDKYYTYDPSGGWTIDYNGITPMVIGKGYSIRAPQNYDINVKADFIGTFTGIPNNGNIPAAVVSGKWNLIGNPYPSAISADKFTADNPGIGALYFWAHVNLPIQSTTDQYLYYKDDFVVYNSLGSTTTGSSNAFQGYIGATQGFIVKAPAATVNFNNDQRRASHNGQFYKTDQSAAVEKNRVWLNFTNASGTFKQILVGYATGATNTTDVDFDAVSMGSNPDIDFYSINNSKKLSIQGRALPFVNSDLIPLGYMLSTAGDYTVAIDHADGLFGSGQDVFLEDKTTGKITNLRLADYTFNSAAGTFNSRFVLRYTSGTLGVDDIESLENSVLVSVKNKVVKITSSKETIKEVNIFDIGAQLLYNKNNVNSSELQISNLQSSDQALLVKITLENGYTFAKKIIYSNL
ncbi:T9SS sorting signal type C domain-containing protein [Flavobacterium panacagri]|uniref:T9SS sorting signal type C domain-containing protein n=1 Tax=Flavobacterium panacagri TaxID=3034146 RepID=UPI0025A5A671|nr:T9SS sorting signal type C domain-containing protein [Flavobacterium panacagri]